MRTPAKFVNWQIIRQGDNRAAYKIMRENYLENLYLNFPALLHDLSRNDLKELHRLVMLKHGDNMPEDEFERVLWGDLKTMFYLPKKTDEIWRLPHQQPVRFWKYFSSCAVHCLQLTTAHIYMLAEVEYPFHPRICKEMLGKKLLGDKEDGTKIQLVELIEKQSKQDAIWGV